MIGVRRIERTGNTRRVCAGAVFAGMPIGMRPSAGEMSGGGGRSGSGPGCGGTRLDVGLLDEEVAPEVCEMLFANGDHGFPGLDVIRAFLPTANSCRCRGVTAACLSVRTALLRTSFDKILTAGDSAY